MAVMRMMIETAVISKSPPKSLVLSFLRAECTDRFCTAPSVLRRLSRAGFELHQKKRRRISHINALKRRRA